MCTGKTFNPSYMLENMALVSLPGTVNTGLCGKATSGVMNKGCGSQCNYLHILLMLNPQVDCFLMRRA